MNEKHLWNFLSLRPWHGRSDLVWAPGRMSHLFGSCFGINCNPERSMDANYCWHNHTILNINNKGRGAITRERKAFLAPKKLLYNSKCPPFFFLGTLAYLYRYIFGNTFDKSLLGNFYLQIYFLTLAFLVYFKFNSNRNKVVLHSSFKFNFLNFEFRKILSLTIFCCF